MTRQTERELTEMLRSAVETLDKVRGHGLLGGASIADFYPGSFALAPARAMLERIDATRNAPATIDLRDTMVREYETWLKAQGLQLGCAMEALVGEDDLTDDQRHWLSDYVVRWEAMERAENHARMGLSPAGDSFEESAERMLAITDGFLIDWRETDAEQHRNDRNDDLAVREIEWLYWRPRMEAAMRLLQDVPTATLVAAQTPDDLIEALQQDQGMKP